MSILQGVLLAAAFGVAAAANGSASASDLARAQTRRPARSSQVSGSTPAAAFAGMNRVLSAGAAQTATCDSFDHSALNDLARALHSLRSEELNSLYESKGDKRKLHFTSLEYKERLWAAEGAAQKIQWKGPGSDAYNATRDGKCAEVVMWYIHHLSETSREELARSANFVLPLMPHSVAPKGLAGHEYALQISCTDCHVAVHIPGAPPIQPAPPRNGTGPQYPEQCPKESVWYNRTKRCDWDYEPFCKPCEGVGGLIWGSGEKDWSPMPCEPVLAPEMIPKANLTSPLWPKAFSVQEYADLTFPGRDPCKINFRNSTYSLYFDTRPEGPLYHTVGHTGPSGPSPFPGKSWALANGNFYNTVDAYEKSLFCICISPRDPATKNAITGPLAYDFNRNAKLVGRERIVPEYLKKTIIADHWVKGPHHFWIDVATNLMVREWQPFNGHQIYYDWNLTRPDPSIIDVPEKCYKGLLHYNVSCAGPPPTSRQEIAYV